MSLEQYRREKMVILTAGATVYQAARAMLENHIGAVLVNRAGRLAGIVTDRDLALSVLAEGCDSGLTTVDDVMSEGVMGCSPNDNLVGAARLMREIGVRRVPVIENERAVGMVTFDDLVLSGEIDGEMLRSIVEAQLVEVEAENKPAGVPYPVPLPADSARRAKAAMRAESRARQVYGRLIRQVADVSGLDARRAEQGFKLATCMLCHRLTPNEAQHLIAQLPSRLHPTLTTCADGPDRAVTADAMQAEIGRALGLDDAAAAEILAAVFAVLSENVTVGEIHEVKSQLPPDMVALFPPVLAA